MRIVNAGLSDNLDCSERDFREFLRQASCLAAMMMHLGAKRAAGGKIRLTNSSSQQDDLFDLSNIAAGWVRSCDAVDGDRYGPP